MNIQVVPGGAADTGGVLAGDVIAAITGVANGRQDVAGLEHHPVKTILVDSGNEVVLEVFRKV